MKMPDAIAHYLTNIDSIDIDSIDIDSIEQSIAYIAYLEISHAGYLRSWGGNLDSYGLQNLSLDEHASKYIQAVHGFFPLQVEPEILPYIQLRPGLIVDIHLFTDQATRPQIIGTQVVKNPVTKAHLLERCAAKPQTTELAANAADYSGWILLINTTEKAQKQQLLQQKGNELRLRHHQQTHRHPTDSNTYKTYLRQGNLRIPGSHLLQNTTDIARSTLYLVEIFP